MKLLIMHFPQPPVTSFLLLFNIFLSTVLSNTRRISLPFALNVRIQFHTYKNGQNYNVVYFNRYSFRQETEIQFRAEMLQLFP